MECRRIQVIIYAQIEIILSFALQYLISTGLAPRLILSKPSFAMDLAKIVAVVVPSPASSFVLFATS